jgi:hypothetical protein
VLFVTKLSSENFSILTSSTEFPSDKMLAVFRNWKTKHAPEDVERIKKLLKAKLSSDNHSTLE